MSVELVYETPFGPEGSHEAAVAGKLSGVFGDRREDGSPCCETIYVDGVKNGAGRMFYRSGKVYAVETWKDGLLDGPTTLYWESGVIQAELPYRAGQLDGLAKEYFESGRIEAELTWVAGKREGVCTLYDEAGNVTKREIYKDDSLVP